jgi:hypothetical protein
MSERDIADRKPLDLLSAHKRVAAGSRIISRAAGNDPTVGTTCRLGDAACAASHATTVSRSVSGQGMSVHRSLRRLQRQYGNQYVGHVLRQAGAMGSEPEMDAVERSIDQARGGGQGMDHGTRTGMESAFGADFSSVRVHTDSRADGLSQSISARAFATGRDVFFRQGEYNPGTSAGRELLAHELTHVVQQNGDGVQRKMTVSEPGDAQEVEADRVAQAVMQHDQAPRLAGQAEVVDAAGASLRDAMVQRDLAQDLADMADAGEAQAGTDRQHNLNQPPASRVSVIQDLHAAQALVSKIEGWRDHMQEGARAGGAFVVSEHRVIPEKMAANEQAISALDDFLVTSGEQSRTLSSFQNALQKSRTNYERLKAQITHLTVTRAVAGGTAGEIGEQVVRGTGFADPTAAQDRMRQLERNPGLLAVHNQVQDAHTQMVSLGQSVGQKQSTVSQAAYSYKSALNSFETGVPSVNDNPEQAAQLSALKSKIEKVKNYVGKGLEYAGKAAEAAGVPHATTVTDRAGPVVDLLTDAYFEPQLNEIQTTIAQYNAAHAEHAITANLDNIRAASRAFTAALTDFRQTVEAFANAQAQFRDKLRALGRSADSGHDDHYAIIASVLAEVDTYVTQLDTTLSLAYQEQTAAREVTSARQTAAGGPGSNGARQPGKTYYEPYRFFHANGGWGYECMPNELRIPTAGRGSAEGDENLGANATVERAIRDLQGFRAEVEPMRRALAQAMDLRMDDAMPQGQDSPPPTQSGANTGL